MIDTLLTAFYILCGLLGFGFVIAIHELGHFVFAKWADVRVHVFSIGFGPVLWRKRIGETDYVLSLLPLGGYVKMEGEYDPSLQPSDGPPRPEEPLDPRSFAAKSATWRALILLGGVFFNLWSSALILLCLAFWGMPVIQPVVGRVEATVLRADGEEERSPASLLGLRNGDRILEMNGSPVRMFEDVQFASIFGSSKPVTLVIERDGQRLELPAASAAAVRIAYNKRVGAGSLGVSQASSNRIEEVGGTEIAGGPRRHERVVRVNNADVSRLTGEQISQRLLPFLGRQVTLGIRGHDGSERDITISYGGRFAGDGADHIVGWPVRVNQVTPDGPAANAGIRRGDLLVALRGEPVLGSTGFLVLATKAIQAGGPVAVTVQRADGSRADIEVTPSWIDGDLRLGIVMENVTSGTLPELPRKAGGATTPLAAAGIASGAVVLRVSPKESAMEVAFAYLPPGVTTTRIALSATAGARLARIETVGLIQRIGDRFGTPRPSSLLAALCAGSIAAPPADEARLYGPASASAVYLARSTHDPVWIDLSAVDGAADLVAQLRQPGRRVLGLVPAAHGYDLEVVDATLVIQTVQIPVAPLGTALFFVPENTPYQLHSTGEAFVLVGDAAWNMIVKSLTLIPRFFQPPESGGVDATKTLSGPVGIYRVMKMQAENGFDGFLRIVALVGLNLFLVNLLPIPITDGGQLVFLAIETVMRRPIPPLVRNIAAYIGLALVVTLMAFTIGLDLLRWIGLM